MSLPVEQQVTITPTAVRRFWTKVDKSGPCWLWTAGRNSDGYGYAAFSGRNVGAHRMAYHLIRGPIPEGDTLDHLCRVRHCVNPDHLEPVTNAVNIQRGRSPWAVNARRVECANGHPFTPENTRMDRGKRYCLTCKRISNRDVARKRRARAKESAA